MLISAMYVGTVQEINFIGQSNVEKLGEETRTPIPVPWAVLVDVMF